MKTGCNILTLVFFLLTGCATKVASIYNYAIVNKKPNTFMVYSENEHVSTAEDSNNLDPVLQKIISESLENQGLKTSSLPDLRVGYQISVHTSSETQGNNYNPYNRYSYNYPYNYSTSNYKEGVLIISVNNDDGKLIWQGSKAFKIRSRKSVQELLPEICREIMTYYKIEAGY